MELPQKRPFGSEGTKSTHDFLSLCSHSTVQQDPIILTSQGGGSGFLKTHDFLQPLERVGKPTGKEETSVEVSTPEKPPFPAPPASVEHVLPGGIGTYSIRHFPYFAQRVAKTEGPIFAVAQASSPEIKNDENSNCSSLSGGGFTLWEESTLNKGKSGKDNVGEQSNIIRGQWNTSERPSLSSSDNHINSFSSISTSKQSGHKSQSFIDIIKSAKGSNCDDDLEDEEEFVLKRENASPIHKGGELRVKVDGRSTDQKPNTPRSKHSATEQRRRSKINDRFQMLREIIPRSDQKRDKASFLLEVIEYIQFLQEKVQKFEGSYQGWTQEPAKLVQWKNNTRHSENCVDHSRGVANGTAPALLVAGKLEEKNIIAAPTVLGHAQDQIEYNITSAAKKFDQLPGITSKGPFVVPLQSNFINSNRNNDALSQYPHKLTSDADNKGTSPQRRSCPTVSSTNDGAIASDKLKQQELNIEGGMINISTAYSQGLLHNLTQTLQSSGVDLSRASVSVQIELGKRARSAVQNSIVKEYQNPSSDQATCSLVSRIEDSDQASKKLKTGKSL